MSLNKIKLGCALLLCAMHMAHALETQLSSEQVSLGDVVYVTYISNNTGTHLTPDFSPLQKDFEIRYTDYGNTVNIINGVTSTQTYWRLQLQPKKVGTLVLPAINFGNEQSTPRQLKVNGYADNPFMRYHTVNTQQTYPVLVRGEISTPSPYVQSQLLYTFKLYFRTQLRDPRIELPQMKDANFYELGATQNYQAALNGQVYNVVQKTFALFPKKPGAMTIEPFKFRALAFNPSANSYDALFNFSEPKSIAAATKPVNLMVRDIPAKYQGTAWLPAKAITVTEQWSDTEHLEPGTPVTRTILVKAQGLRADQLPDFSFDKIAGISVYAERPKRSNVPHTDAIEGVYEQKITYIPNNVASFTIPALTLNWWNIKTDNNAVAQLQQRTLRVNAAVGAVNAPNSSVMKATATPIKSISTPFYQTLWFWIATTLFALWIVTVWFMLRKKPAACAEKRLTTNLSPEKALEEACHSNQPDAALQSLLAWAKTKWPNRALNLSTLRELIKDDAFQQALAELEKTLYAKKTGVWNGTALLIAFKRVKKLHTPFNQASKRHDPLPPLNPQ